MGVSLDGMELVMAEEQDIEQESIIQKWAPYLVGVVLVVAVGFYISQFHDGLSTDQGTWGEFGDFVGGAVNPIIGFFTIWLLAVSLRQNHKALRQANTALAQAKAELELTRIAVEDAKQMQAATETALKAQTAIAENARDMNNAIAIYKGLDEDVMRLTQRIEAEGKEADVIKQMKTSLIITNAQKQMLASALSRETYRLIQAYTAEDVRAKHTKEIDEIFARNNKTYSKEVYNKEKP